MKTDELIEALAISLEPVAPAGPSGPWLVAAAGASLAAVALLLGVRNDLVSELTTAAVWLKTAYTLGLATAGIWVAWRLSCPGADPRHAAWALMALVTLAMGWAGAEMVVTPSSERLTEWLGHTWRICSRDIFLVSLFSGPFVFLSVRGLAPTRPTSTGAALGATAGSLAATAYGVLHCPEVTASFIATWYTLGIAAAAAAGAAAGRLALRW